MTNILQHIENIRIKATQLVNQNYIPDNILRTEVQTSGDTILTEANELWNECQKPSLAILQEIGTLQNNYQYLKSTNHLTKQDICNLVIPFRDKYHLTDIQALQITRDEISLCKIAEYLSQE